jgi:hypothetical protein
LNHAANIVVVAGKEKFQGVSILPEQQAHFQSGAALENVFLQPPDGNSPPLRVQMLFYCSKKNKFNYNRRRLFANPQAAKGFASATPIDSL